MREDFRLYGGSLCLLERWHKGECCAFKLTNSTTPTPSNFVPIRGTRLYIYVGRSPQSLPIKFITPRR